MRLPQSRPLNYDGLSITSTDPQSKARVDKLSPLGQIMRAIQASGTGDETQANYDYDAFGNLVRVTDAASNQSLIGYNIRGFKISSSDPDMGAWTYDYYALGELKQQTDAKLQVTTFTYDKLSRPLTRVEPSDAGSGTQTTVWTWGNSAAAFNIGQLQSIARGGYSETNTYDNRSRLMSKSVIADGGTYVIGQSYNATTGLLETVTYPASTGATPFKVKYEYETANKSGLVQRIKDFNAGTVFWQATSTNAFGQYQDITLGNGLKTLTAFDSVTGTTNRIETGPAGGNSRQHLQYLRDKVGNLISRQDLNISKLETFTYDNLYRLRQASVTGGSTLTVAYNAIGNITSKSDVGAYAYDPVKKHAVTSAGTYSFTYDPNGNAITQNGASISWTAYNLPKLINQTGGNNSQFLYGPDRQRYKHVALNGATTETTIYVGGIFEKLTRNGTAEYKHSVVGPDAVVAIHNRKSTGVNATLYPLQDHLGSTDVVTDASGASLVKLSFTPFGARRNGTTWSGAPTAADLTAISNTTRRGFTDHEQLDNLGLIHMNGRVYHPVVGRFISADPFVQAPFNTQSLNRYSYVFNNPLSFVDPSGFSRCNPDGECGGNIPGGFVFNGPSTGRTPRELIPDGPSSDTPVVPIPQTTPAPAPVPQPVPQPEPTMGPRMPPMVNMFMGGQVTRNNGEGWMNAKLLRNVASIGVGAVPFAGSIQSVVELVSGQDYITGEETSRVLAGVGIVAGLIPFGKAAVKGISKLVGRGDEVVDAAAGIAARTCCFVAGTLVMTESGLRPIEEIEVGDRVLSRDEVTGETAFKPVTELIRRHEREIWGLTLQVDDQQGKRIVLFETTDDHPWRSAENQWLATTELSIGVKILRANGTPAVVMSVARANRTAPTFNLEIADFHTYFVGESGAWVHNACGASLGERVFSSTGGRTGIIAEDVIKQGSTLTFKNFTIASGARGRDLLGPARQLLEFAMQQGAQTLRFKGTFSNAELAAQFGKRAGDSFEITVGATRSGILEALRRL
jgi:RHS repeat-associated protein